MLLPVRTVKCFISTWYNAITNNSKKGKAEKSHIIKIFKVALL